MARYTGPACKLCRREGKSFSSRVTDAIQVNVLLTVVPMHLVSMVKTAKKLRNMVFSFVLSRALAVTMALLRVSSINISLWLKEKPV